MKLVNIGFGNIIALDRVISIVSPESAPIKRLVQDKFGIALHFHDSCGGGTYFSIEQKNDEITAFLQEYFASRHIHLSVSENGLNYTAE